MGKKKKKGTKALAIPVDVSTAPVVGWEISGLSDANGDRLTPGDLKKSPPVLVVTAGGAPVVSMLLTSGSLQRLQAGLTEAGHAIAGTSPEPPKGAGDRLLSVLAWCMAHKVRGALLALFTLGMAYSIIAGAFRLA